MFVAATTGPRPRDMCTCVRAPAAHERAFEARARSRGAVRGRGGGKGPSLAEQMATSIGPDSSRQHARDGAERPKNGCECKCECVKEAASLRELKGLQRSLQQQRHKLFAAVLIRSEAALRTPHTCLRPSAWIMWPRTLPRAACRACGCVAGLMVQLIRLGLALGVDAEVATSVLEQAGAEGRPVVSSKNSNNNSSSDTNDSSVWLRLHDRLDHLNAHLRSGCVRLALSKQRVDASQVRVLFIEFQCT